MEQDTFRQSRKPAVVQDDPAMEQIPIPDNAPPQLQQMLQRANAAKAAKTEEVPQSTGPRLAFTGNSKLDELLAGMKEMVHHYEEVVLPSRGKFYDGVVAPEDGVIHVRCMTGEEAHILGTPRYIKKGLAINMIFKNCVRENIVPEKLLTIDRTWLLIYLRGISYSNEYDVEVRCSECNTKFETNVDLDRLFVTRCPDNFGPDKMRGVLPKSGYSFTYRLPTGYDENLIQEHRDRRIKQNTDGGHDDTWTFRASLLIEDIEGLTDQAAIQALLSRMPIQDLGHIRNLLNEPPFGVDTKVSIICPNCTEEFSVEMPMDANFFFPKPKKAKN